MLKQIGDVELDIDTLIKLTKEDLWKRDLDDFINEWRFQLEDEDKRQKKVANMGRRASSKLKIGAALPSRKRKGGSDDDSDFGGSKPSKKAAIAKPQGGMLSYLSEKPTKPKQSKTQPPKAPPKEPEDVKPVEVKPAKKAVNDVWMSLDDVDESLKKTAAARPKKAAPQVIESEDSADEEIVRPVKPREPRAAAKKRARYALSDSDDDNGDDLLFDVGKMVKGIGEPSGDQSATARPLFSASMSRPGSSAGLHKKSRSERQTIGDMEADDTDYALLAPSTGKKGIAVTAKNTILDDDSDDSFGVAASPPPKVSKPKQVKATKPTAKAVSKAPAKKAASAKPEQKPMALSPAGKAYAARKARENAAKASKLDDSEDEVEKVANEILDDDDDDDDDEEVAPKARPVRRAAQKKALVVESEEDEDEESEDDFEVDDDDD